MNQYIQAAKTSLQTHKKEYIIGTSVTVGIVLLATIIISLFLQNNGPRVDYQPAAACDLLTDNEARSLLGSNTVNSTSNGPVVSGDTAVSRCGYTDGNPDTDNMIVAAITVRSGINDKGVAQNKTEFTAGAKVKNSEIVKDLGDGAFYNAELGQLNVLDGRKWIILSYGVGSAPEANTLDKSLELAHEIVELKPMSVKF